MWSYMAMKEARIAELKSHLSKYLQYVRLGGEVVISDRDTPIARLIPHEKKKEKIVIKPGRGSFKEVFKHFKAPPADPGADSLKALLATREDDLESW